MINKIFLISILSFFLTVNCFSAGSSSSDSGNNETNYDKAVSHINSAKKYEKKGNNKKANKSYEKALDLLVKSNMEKPNSADTLNYLGFTTRKLGDFSNGEYNLSSNEISLATSSFFLIYAQVFVVPKSIPILNLSFATKDCLALGKIISPIVLLSSAGMKCLISFSKEASQTIASGGSDMTCSSLITVDSPPKSSFFDSFTTLPLRCSKIFKVFFSLSYFLVSCVN